MNPIIEAPRLRLTRVICIDLDSEHLAWFHQVWSDETATAWSLHGHTKTLSESQQWMAELVKNDEIMYAVHVKSAPDSPQTSDLHEVIESGAIGILGLRRLNNATLPPPTPTTDSGSIGWPVLKKLNDATLLSPAPRGYMQTGNSITIIRSIGYQILQSSWGKGYATEAVSALLSCYGEATRLEEESGRYVEAIVGKDNAASIRVIEKLGFQKAGWKEETEGVFLAGKWRDPGYWVYGKYV
ncbi:hypothetical protein K469DRAFT_680726 [Zopfia rhizophila CBS 207.26]|uniref:N-acetyltransferase domain-containing protein n=1 Tax=Zopfia rhizophila CBS 207.26 TaxID=1314779 RepID=A0A6A6D6A3_9PEZI|nr:hypothetical protein K469DRAFT_680726 [Zopfia rhizophila CBS 207.26]